MNYKTAALIIFSLIFLYRLMLQIIEYRSALNPIPENVKDIYDPETYQRWRAYHKEKCALELAGCIGSYLVNLILICLDFYAFLVRGLEGHIYAQAIVVLIVFFLIDTALDSILNYVDTMKIEQKYGFNNTTMKTFIMDRIKEWLINSILTVGLLCLFILLHQTLGDWLLVMFTGIMILVMLAIMFLYPVLSKIFNRFTPLPEGELKDKLTGLLEKYGYKVKSIDVMNASERTTKSNAYFTGFGRMKTIVLFDNLLNTMTPDEICATFAHELGHGLNKDTLKNNIFNFVQIVFMVVLIWLNVRYPQIYYSFGFEGVNYGFAFILLMMVELSCVQPLFELVVNWLSRRAEYRADQQAVKEGYGEALISGLKKLSKENFANLSPAPVLVKLTYSHPPLSERIAAIEKRI